MLLCGVITRGSDYTKHRVLAGNTPSQPTKDGQAKTIFPDATVRHVHVAGVIYRIKLIGQKSTTAAKCPTVNRMSAAER